MDPKTLAGLDPKLRETYEKVMGAAASAQNPSAPAAPPSAIISNTPIPPPVMPQNPAESKPADNPTASPVPAMPAEQKTADVLSSSLESNPVLSAQPVQPADMSDLQPSLSGSPLPASESAAILNKPLQPLPSPASVNHQAAQTGGSSGIMKIVYIIAGVVFFIVYAIFWMKIFNFPLPF